MNECAGLCVVMDFLKKIVDLINHYICSDFYNYLQIIFCVRLNTRTTSVWVGAEHNLCGGQKTSVHWSQLIRI